MIIDAFHEEKVVLTHQVTNVWQVVRQRRLAGPRRDDEVTVTGQQDIKQSFNSHLFLHVIRKEFLPIYVLRIETKERG